jgi:hypothetical protein
MTTTLSPENYADTRDADTRIRAEVPAIDETVRVTSIAVPAHTETVPASTPAGHAGVPASTDEVLADTPAVPAPSSAGDAGGHAPSGASAPADLASTTETDAETPASTEEVPAPSSASAALAGLSKAEQARYACEHLHTTTGTPPTTESVRSWLEAHGVSLSRRYASRIVNDWKDANGLTTTDSGLPKMTAHALAAIEAAAEAGVFAPRKQVAVLDEGQDIDEPEQIDAEVLDERPAEPELDDPEIAALADQVARARGRLVYQDDAALREALSADELAAERDLAELERQVDREVRQHAAIAKRARLIKVQKALQAEADAEDKEARWHRRALSRRQRLISPDAQLTRLYKRATLSDRLLIGVLVMCMIWSGYNVQTNLAAGLGPQNLLWWLAFGLEAVISVPIIVIMLTLTSSKKELPKGRGLSRSVVIPVEVGLLALTLALNIGPRLVAGEWGRAAEYAIAPVIVALVVWLHAGVTDHYAYLITDADTESRADH